ncbi:hypothetical protein HF521_013349 [Silurus meridionalis]|uniref:Uncharacterized protein n=1 Tax=Silurus meridionalis TaxID=175797 RepID=A0A8T0A974_SILME|nr:hypothetical protein HF521_013349 [Silurus meridionalis]
MEFARKRQSFEEREDCMCRITPGLHESLHFNTTRSKSLQLDSAGISTSGISTDSLSPKLFSPRGESAVEKLQIISSTEGSIRKTSSEYKLEARLVSSLKPLKGTLDIGLLSGPRISKTDSCLSKIANSQTDGGLSPTLQTSSEKQHQMPTNKQIQTATETETLGASSSKNAGKEEPTCSRDSLVCSVSHEGNPDKNMQGEEIRLQAVSSKIEPIDLSAGGKPETKLKAVQEMRPARHCTHFACGKTPSIREVSNEDQDDEMENPEEKSTFQNNTVETKTQLTCDRVIMQNPSISSDVYGVDKHVMASALYLPPKPDRTLSAQKSDLDSTGGIGVSEQKKPESIAQNVPKISEKIHEQTSINSTPVLNVKEQMHSEGLDKANVSVPHSSALTSVSTTSSSSSAASPAPDIKLPPDPPPQTRQDRKNDASPKCALSKTSFAVVLQSPQLVPKSPLTSVKVKSESSASKHSQQETLKSVKNSGSGNSLKISDARSKDDDHVKTQNGGVEDRKRCSSQCQEPCAVKIQIKDEDHKTCIVPEGWSKESKMTSTKDKTAQIIAVSKEDAKCAMPSETCSTAEVNYRGQMLPNKSNQDSVAKAAQVQSANMLKEKIKVKNITDAVSQKITKPVPDVCKKEVVTATKKQPPQPSGTSSTAKQGLSSSKNKSKLETPSVSHQSGKATEERGAHDNKAPLRLIKDNADLKPKDERESPLPPSKSQPHRENLPQTGSQIGPVIVPSVKVHTPSGSPTGKGTGAMAETSKPTDSSQKVNRKDSPKSIAPAKEGAVPEKDSPRVKQSKELPRGSNNKK